MIAGRKDRKKVISSKCLQLHMRVILKSPGHNNTTVCPLGSVTTTQLRQLPDALIKVHSLLNTATAWGCLCGDWFQLFYLVPCHPVTLSPCHPVTFVTLLPSFNPHPLHPSHFDAGDLKKRISLLAVTATAASTIKPTMRYCHSISGEY